MSAHIQQASVLTGRQMVMLAIVVLHALVISALLAIKVVPDAAVPDVPLIGRFLPDQRIAEPPPDLGEPVPARARARFDFAAPRLDFPSEAETSDEVIRPPVGDSIGPLESEASPESASASIPPTPLQFRAVRPAEEYYPPHSVRMQEEGVAVVRICVGPGGSIEGRPSIEHSSGSRSLDAAALRWAREALVFTPATERGMAVAACRGFRVNFTLQ